MVSSRILAALTCCILLVQPELCFINKSCLSPDKSKVDWYVVFLFPTNGHDEKILKYGYFDNYSKLMSYHTFEEATFPPLLFVDEAEEKTKKFNYFFWNDNLSTTKEDKMASYGRAHSKGGLVYDETSGAFLSHSLPRFPNRDGYGNILETMPGNSGIYGQTFICLSLDKENSTEIIDTLNIINPKITLGVDRDFVDGTKSSPEVEKFIKNRFDRSLADFKTTKIFTRLGEKFHVFSKSRDYKELPYDMLIPEHFKDGFFVETWTRPRMVPSKCDTPHHVFNVEKLKFGNIEYTNGQEHSKWAVSMNKDVCCFGDLNRTESQKKRGGNTICFKNRHLASIMRQAIVQTEPCKKSYCQKKLEKLERELNNLKLN